ncbi:MAG TPA: SIR2 family protein [Polyangiaceae bacterium]|nr:SIR2 family protein [Polyangiaceae bacterium]
MTDRVRELLWQPTHQLLLDYIQHTLEADVARRAATADFRAVVPAVDIERLFASIELLIDRYEQPWSPFVASWAAGLESFAPAGDIHLLGLTPMLNQFTTALDAALREATRGNFLSGRNIGSALEAVVTRAITTTQPRDVSRALEQLRDEMIKSLSTVLTPTESVDYLNPLIDLAEDQQTLTVGTLNYDRCVELAAEKRGTPCDTAIESWLRDPNEWPATGIQLLKLHGSIDWVLDTDSHPLPQAVVRLAQPEERVRRPAIVFGEGGKLRSEGPYLELLLRWARTLDDADRLLIVGYSFRDEHINETIARWFNRDSARRIVLVTPGPLPAAGWRGRRLNPFLTDLASVDEEHLGEPRRWRRLWHVEHRACDGLAEAIAVARSVGEWEQSASGEAPTTGPA